MPGRVIAGLQPAAAPARGFTAPPETLGKTTLWLERPLVTGKRQLQMNRPHAAVFPVVLRRGKLLRDTRSP
jgi:hypothetical protein